MKKYQLALSLFVVCIAVNLSTSVSFAASGPIKVIAFGDSITAGMFRTASNFRRCTHDGSTGPTLLCRGNGIVNKGGYVPFLADQLDDEGYSATVYNWGISGDLTSGMLNRMNSVMNSSPSDYIAIMGGANDARRNYSRSLIIFNYKEMIKKALEAEVIPLIGTVTPNLENSQFKVRVESYNVEIRKIADSITCGSSLADQGIKLANFDAYDSGDLLHVGPVGNQRMADEWLTAIENVRNCVNIAPIISLLLLDDD